MRTFLASFAAIFAFATVGYAQTTTGAAQTDIVMPKIRGTDLAKRLKKMLPDVKIIYMSGYLDVRDTELGVLVGNHILQKPFTKESLVGKVTEALNAAVLSTPEIPSSGRAPRPRISRTGSSVA